MPGTCGTAPAERDGVVITLSGVVTVAGVRWQVTASEQTFTTNAMFMDKVHPFCDFA